VKFGIGVLLLLGLLVAAVLMQRNLRSKALEERHRARSAAELEDGWGRVVVGAPSGAPLPGEEGSFTEPAPAAGVVTVPPPPPPVDKRVRVEPGMSLSKICEEQYGTSRGGLLEALATYNGLESPGAIRVGQELRLPPRERLERKQED
jgi:nucleoid-associated protein YgaU